MQDLGNKYTVPLGGFFHARGGFSQSSGMKGREYRKNITNTPAVQNEKPNAPVKTDRVPDDKPQMRISKLVNITEPEINETINPVLTGV